MASIGEVIYEDHLYKFTGRSRSIFWGKANPWREKYFILKRVGNKPVLEYYNKKPKMKHSSPKEKIELWPSFRVEKITNMKNRAYVFQVTTPSTTLCLSADEQRGMDIFVFFLQLQCRLKEQIAEDLFCVEPENSEALRRIGAKGTNSLLHVSPFGVTLALQSNKAILAQWPLKSIRSYESSERGQFSIEAGRIAPMGDGLYIFHVQPGEDAVIYDLLDSYVMENMQKLQPGQRNDTEDLEGYVLEAERLLALSVVSACTTDNDDVRFIVNSNWNTDLITPPSARPRQIVHTRLKTSSSAGSVNSPNNSFLGIQSAPAREVPDRATPQMSRSQPAHTDSPAGLRKGSSHSQFSIVNRPPLPPPSSSIPNKSTTSLKLHGKGLARSASQDTYLRMNSSSSTSSTQFSPSPSENMAPPKYRDTMRQQKSTSPISEMGPYEPGSYLTPSPGLGPSTSTPNHQSMAAEYLTPLSPMSEEVNNNTRANGSNSRTRSKLYSGTYADMSGQGNDDLQAKARIRRLRSISCEDFSDYLRNVVYDPKSLSMDDLLDDEAGAEDKYMGPEPFPRLQTYSAADFSHQHAIENYYNIEGLKGKIYDGPGLPVHELIYRFSKKARTKSRLRRSVSNPNFIGNVSKEKLHSARVSAMYTAKINKHKDHSSSISNLLPESLKKHLTKDHKGSHGTLSSGTVSPKSSKASSRASSTRSSPVNMRKRCSLPRDEVIASTGVKGINITRRSRSFKKEKPDKHTNSRPVDQTTKNQNQHRGEELDVDQGSRVKPRSGSGGLGETGVTTEGTSIDLQELRDDTSASRSTHSPPVKAPKPKVVKPATTEL